MPKPEINEDYDDTKLTILRNFNQKIAAQFSSHRNYIVATRVIETLMYIKLNLELIRYAVEHRDDKSLYTYTHADLGHASDIQKGVLRAPNDMSFHIHSYSANQGNKAVADLSNLIESIEHGIEQMGDNSEQIQTFIQTINDNQVGWLEARLGKTLTYLASLDVAKLDDLFAQWNEQFNQRYPDQTEQAQPLLFFQNILNFFTSDINRKINYQNETSSLTWTMIIDYANQILGFDLQEVITKPQNSPDNGPELSNYADCYALWLKYQAELGNINSETQSKFLARAYAWLSNLFKLSLFSEAQLTPNTHQLVTDALHWRLLQLFPEPLSHLLDQPVQKKSSLWRLYQSQTLTLRDYLITHLVDVDKIYSVCEALEQNNPEQIRHALGISDLAASISSAEKRPYVGAWLEWQLKQRFDEPLNSILNQPVTINAKSISLRSHLLKMLSPNFSNSKTLYKILAICNALKANDETALITALDIPRGFPLYPTTSRRIFDQAQKDYTPNTSTELEPAAREAFLFYYGKSFDTQVTSLKASNRTYHGIMHALACMKLIPEVHALYVAHVSGYETEIANIAQLFQITPEQLLNLIQHVALMHDSGRMEDGVDFWDGASADNLAYSLLTKNIPRSLATLLRLTILYKDDPTTFITEAQKIFPDSACQFDYLRQLLCMADTLEVIRVRKRFDYHYFPITQIEPSNLLKPQELQLKLDELVRAVATKIDREARTPLKTHQVIRADKSQFTITHPDTKRLDLKQQEQAFQDAFAELQTLSNSKNNPLT